jgi:beta-glucuronidase
VLFRSLVLSLVITLCACPAARAQGPVYPPDTPVQGSVYRDGQTDRYLVGGTWLYRPDRADAGIAEGFWRDVAATDGWSPVSVPNAYNAGDQSTASMVGYVGWYRKDFSLPTSGLPRGARVADLHWILRFESVNYRAEIWLNGRLVGQHVGAFLPFEVDLAGLRLHGVNRLVVRVDDRHYLSDLPPGPAGGGRTDIGGWWNYGGILREVYLRPVDRVDIAQVQVRPLLACPSCSAMIDEQALVRNVTGSAQTVRLRGTYGGTRLDFGQRTIAPGRTWTAHALVRVARPRLWAPGSPTLYRATLTASDPKGNELAGYLTYSGIRSIALSGGRLLLNGRRLDLRGVGLQEQDIALGGGLNPAHIRRLVDWTRSLGADLIRGQYPSDPLLEELADRYGILLWSEIPVYQTQLQYLTQPAWVGFVHSMLQQNILANQNHPSILLWSVGNELVSPAPPQEGTYIAGAVSLAHRLDPTRPVGMAVGAWPGVGCQRAYAPLDVVGFNDYFGWYSVARGATADRDQLGPFLDSFHACYPTKALFVSEFGFEADRSGPVEQRGTYAFQVASATYHLSVFDQKPWLSGSIYWALQDFVCRPGWAGGNPLSDPPFFNKGLVDFLGQPKPAFTALQSIYRSAAQIAP